MTKRLFIFMLLLLALTGCTVSEFSPKPGAQLSGPIDIRHDKARTGMIYLELSEDGKAIKDVTIRLMGVQCEGVTTSLVDYTVTVNSPIDGSAINIKSDDIGTISGRFYSTTEAAGNIHLILSQNVVGTQANCDLALWKWKAIVKNIE